MVQSKKKELVSCQKSGKSMKILVYFNFLQTLRKINRIVSVAGEWRGIVSLMTGELFLSHIYDLKWSRAVGCTAKFSQ